MLSEIKSKWNKIPITVKVSTSYTICSILQKCISFITLPLFTRLLSTSEYGQYTVYSSWSGILSIFLTLNLAYGSFSTAMVKFEDKRDEYISSIQGICLSLTTIFLLIYIPFHKFWNRLFELPVEIILLMVFEILTHTAILLWSGKKRFEYKYKSVVAVTLVISVIGPVLAYILVINAEDRGVARIFGYAVTTIIAGLIIFISNTIKGKNLFNKEFWKYAFKFNIPLLAYYLSQVIFNQSDRIMISKLLNKESAAMYGVAYNLATILTFVLNAINNAYVPWYYEKIKKGKTSENKAISNMIALIMAALILCVIWFAPEIIYILAGKNYAHAVYVVPPVAMSLLLLFYSQLFINVEFYYEEKKSLVFASIGSAVVNILLNYLFIPMYGFVAAGYTTLASYILFVLANCYAMKILLRKKEIEDDAYSYKSLILIFVVFAALGFAGMVLYDYMVWRIVGAVIILVVLVLNRKKILGIMKKIKER